MTELNRRDFHSCGNDVYIAPSVIIKRPHLFSVGNRVAIDDFGYITCKATFGNVIHAATGLVVMGYGSEFIAEDFTNFSPRCTIVCATDSWMGDGLVSPLVPDEYRNKVINEPVVMKQYSGMGTNSTLMSGVTLGEGAVLAAHSFANKPIPDWQIWGGVPARYIKMRPKDKILEYAEKVRQEHPEWFA